jgi:hypothetical protein
MSRTNGGGNSGGSNSGGSNSGSDNSGGLVLDELDYRSDDDTLSNSASARPSSF